MLIVEILFIFSVPYLGSCPLLGIDELISLIYFKLRAC